MTEANYGCQKEFLSSLYQKIIICLKMENSHKKDSSMPVLTHTPQVLLCQLWMRGVSNRYNNHAIVLVIPINFLLSSDHTHLSLNPSAPKSLFTHLERVVFLVY